MMGSAARNTEVRTVQARRARICKGSHLSRIGACCSRRNHGPRRNITVSHCFHVHEKERESIIQGPRILGKTIGAEGLSATCP